MQLLTDIFLYRNHADPDDIIDLDIVVLNAKNENQTKLHSLIQDKIICSLNNKFKDYYSIKYENLENQFKLDNIVKEKRYHLLNLLNN